MLDDLDDSDTARPRGYWAQRHGEAGGRIDLPTACRLFRSTISALSADAYLQAWAGYTCVDEGNVSGSGGSDLITYAFRKTRLGDLWPPSEAWDHWDEAHLLTAVEFFHDVVSKPVEGRFHTFNDCGYHASQFNRADGRRRYRAEVNSFLIDLGEGFELGADGDVVRAVPNGLEGLAVEPLAATAGSERARALGHALRTFRARGSTEFDQRDAIKTLADLLESIRPELKTLFTHKDEADLFLIANGFNLRHRNAAQQTHYDPAVFLPWLFYTYLAAVHAAFKLLERQAVAAKSADEI